MYRIVPDDATLQQVAALQAVSAYADVLAAVELTPWNGPPHHEANQDGAVRRWSFGPDGAGQVTYLVLETGARSTCFSFSGSAEPARP